MKYLLAIGFVQFCWYSAFSQTSPPPASSGWINGAVLSAEDMRPVPSASVMIEGTNYGMLTNAEGVFRLRADSGAVLRITHLSFQTKIVAISGNTAVAEQGIVIVLQQDSSHMLAPVTVFGVDRQRFERDFLKLKINDSLNKQARANASREKLSALRYSTATSGSESYSLLRHKEAEKKALSNRVPYFAFFDLFTYYKIYQQKRKARKKVKQISLAN